MAEAPRTSYYDILGVPPEAGSKAIKDAYRRAARNAHPDLGGSAAQFHEVTVAFETLGDPRRRERYDSETRRGGSPGTSGPADTRRSPSPRPEASRADPGRVEDEDAAGSAAEYVPPFRPNEPPAVPLILAGKQLHGEPRQPRGFARLSTGARARVDGELRTAALLERSLLPSYPAVRLVNGLEFDDRERTTAGHVLLAGHRLAVLDSFTAAPGNFSWDGWSLRHQGRPVEVQVSRTVRVLQELFPDLEVAGWLVVHGAPDNPFAPVIDVPPTFDRSSSAVVQVVNAGTAVRTIRSFLASGTAPNVVQLPVLAQLLSATDG